MSIIELQDITKKYKDVNALDRFSLSIEEGELLGLLGVNGAGKTTLVKLCTGLIEKDDGIVSICGFDLSELDKIKKVVDYSPQETSVALNLTVRENLEFFASIYGKKSAERIDFLISDFGLNEVENKKAKLLSGGYQRRLSIAIALISEPRVLFLDEPTLGLDVLSRRGLWKNIQFLKGKVTMILTSHYLDEIETLCDRVAIISKGRLLTSGTVSEIVAETRTNSLEDAFVKLVGEEI